MLRCGALTRRTRRHSLGVATELPQSLRHELPQSLDRRRPVRAFWTSTTFDLAAKTGEVWSSSTRAGADNWDHDACARSVRMLAPVSLHGEKLGRLPRVRRRSHRRTETWRRRRAVAYGSGR